MARARRGPGPWRRGRARRRARSAGDASWRLPPGAGAIRAAGAAIHRERAGSQYNAPMSRRLIPVLAALAFAAAPLPWAHADGVMLIQAGAFWMGRDDGAPEEAPLHRVFVRDFWLDRHKVTNREVALFLEARGLWSAAGADYFDAGDPDARIHRRDGRFIADPGFEDHPAVEVSWY